MPRLPELRFHKRMQLMRSDPNVFSRMESSTEQPHVTPAVPGFATDDPRPNSLSLVETVERLVRDGYAGRLRAGR